MAVPVLNEDTETMNRQRDLIQMMIQILEELFGHDIDLTALPPQPPRPPPQPEAPNMLQFSLGLAAVVAGRSMSMISWTKSSFVIRLADRRLRDVVAVQTDGIWRLLQNLIDQHSDMMRNSCREDLSRN
ncbi:Hypothetical predicted protein [Cloeon dipterum]|uniref:Uncharacterized protein n=1 Tax=Cloeon dipterum TaxID=197152 RepID=A0A8S1CPA4_9INSE|nr:Hypothetical predicted protein [Cloeon dipterum]